MPNIIIHGSTLGSNFGDCLFAQLFYRYCEQCNPDGNLFYENKLPFKNDAVALSDTFRKAMGYNKKCTFRDVRHCDGIVFMAGGYFGQTTPSLKEALLRHYKHIKLGLYAKWLKKPLAIIGVEAGPISRKFLVRDIRRVFDHASVITVRNEASKAFLTDIGVKKDIIVTADAAQVVDTSYAQPLPSALAEDIRTRCGNRKLVVMHSVTPLSQIETVKEKIMPALKHFLQAHDYGVIFTVDQCSADRTEALQALAEAAECPHYYVYQYKDPDEMIALLNRADLIITTKLHVGIVGCALQKPVVSFPFNSTKIMRYYQQIGCAERCRPIREVTAAAAEQVIQQWYDKPVVLSETIRKMAQRNFEELKRFINMTGDGDKHDKK